jgi:prepilin-type N-terminal cleavage/methylation domain-containing protein
VRARAAAEPIATRDEENRMAVRPRPGQQRAFTLVELMVVMAILIILAAISLTAVEHIDTGNKKYTTKGLLMRVRQGLSAYQGDFDAYPDCAIHQNFNKHGKLGPVRHPDTDVDGNVIGVIIGNPGNNAGLNATQIRKPVPTTDPEVNDDEGKHLSWTFYVANKHLVEQTSYVLKKQLVDADYTEYPSSYIGGGGPVDFDNDNYIAEDASNSWTPAPGTHDGDADKKEDDTIEDPIDPGYNPTDEDPSETSGRSSAERFRGGLKDAWGRPLVYLYWNGTQYVNDEGDPGSNDNSVTSFSNTQRPVGMPGPIAGMEDTPEVWSGGPDKNWQDFRSPGGGGDPDNDNMSAMDVPDY